MPSKAWISLIGTIVVIALSVRQWRQYKPPPKRTILIQGKEERW